MVKIKSIGDLQRLRNQLKSDLSLRERSDNPDKYVQVKVAMGACGIKAGAKAIMNRFIEKADEEKIAIIVTQTDCMGHCSEEPMVEIKIPEQAAVVFGSLPLQKVDEIVDTYIKSKEPIEGAIQPTAK